MIAIVQVNGEGVATSAAVRVGPLPLPNKSNNAGSTLINIKVAHCGHIASSRLVHHKKSRIQMKASGQDQSNGRDDRTSAMHQ
jgi:hypothetical protein